MDAAPRPCHVRVAPLRDAGNDYYLRSSAQDGFRRTRARDAQLRAYWKVCEPSGSAALRAFPKSLVAAWAATMPKGAWPIDTGSLDRSVALRWLAKCPDRRYRR